MLALGLLLLAAPELEATIFAARPAVLATGQLLGPSLGAGWAIEDLQLGVRAQLGFAEENDLAFAVTHTELRALGIGRWIHRVGRGAIGLGAGAGLVFLYESRTRHQADRLEASGLSLSSTGSGAGPIFVVDAQVSVEVVAGISLVVEAGPSVSFVSGAGEGLRIGWSAGLGLKKSFGDDAPAAKR